MLSLESNLLKRINYKDYKNIRSNERYCYYLHWKRAKLLSTKTHNNLRLDLSRQ